MKQRACYRRMQHKAQCMAKGIRVCDRKSRALPLTTESRTKSGYVRLITHNIPAFFFDFPTLEFNFRDCMVTKTMIFEE